VFSRNGKPIRKIYNSGSKAAHPVKTNGGCESHFICAYKRGAGDCSAQSVDSEGINVHAIIGARLLSRKVAQPTKKPFEIYDSRLPGFTLRVQPSGVRSYYARCPRLVTVVLRGTVCGLPASFLGMLSVAESDPRSSANNTTTVSRLRSGAKCAR